MTIYTDSATVYVDITPSGTELSTGPRVDAATVRVSLGVRGFEGDFAISDLSAVIVGEDAVPSTPGSPLPPEDNDATVQRANFIGEGLIRLRYGTVPATQRFEGVESNRFTGKLGV